MGLEFPLPRSQLPRIGVTPREHAAAKQMMERMVEHTVREFEQFTYEESGKVDTHRWKPMAAKDELQVYKEQQAGTMSKSLAFALEDGGIVAEDLPLGSIMASLTPTTMLMTGYCTGRVENAMYACVTETQEDLALIVTFLHQDVADCAILSTMEGPTEQEPYRYLGYKYFVRKSPGLPQLIKHRNSLYLEYTGVTTTITGEELGFHMMHSVDLPSFPDLTEYNSITVLSSLRYLYRQRKENLVEVFCLGNMDISGLIVQPISKLFVTEIMFGCTKLIECAEVKRLTEMVKRRQQQRLASTEAEREMELLHVRTRRNDECHTCRHRKKLFSGALLGECMVCRELVCHNCRTIRKLFVPDEIMGKFRKVPCCKACVLLLNSAGASLPRINAYWGHNTADEGDLKASSSHYKLANHRTYFYSSSETSSISRPESMSDIASQYEACLIEDFDEEPRASQQQLQQQQKLFQPWASALSSKRSTSVYQEQHQPLRRSSVRMRQAKSVDYGSQPQQVASHATAGESSQTDLIPLLEFVPANDLKEPAAPAPQNDLIPLELVYVDDKNSSVSVALSNIYIRGNTATSQTTNSTTTDPSTEEKD